MTYKLVGKYKWKVSSLPIIMSLTKNDNLLICITVIKIPLPNHANIRNIVGCLGCIKLLLDVFDWQLWWPSENMKMFS